MSHAEAGTGPQYGIHLNSDLPNTIIYIPTAPYNGSYQHPIWLIWHHILLNTGIISASINGSRY